MFPRIFHAYTRRNAAAAEIPRISEADSNDFGVPITPQTTNFKLGEHQFRLPDYFAGRVRRVHLTQPDSSDEFSFQRLGIGKGRRHPPQAVVLVDSKNTANQLCIYRDAGAIWIKLLGTDTVPEKITFAQDRQSGTPSRHSFLERSPAGIAFTDTLLGIGASKTRTRTVIGALNALARENPALRIPVGKSHAFFSKEYQLDFSEQLQQYSFVSILRDRPQRGRFFAVVDRLNPDNVVVFERRGQTIWVLGETERPLFDLTIHDGPATQSLYFSAIPEGAAFCRAVSRTLKIFPLTGVSGKFSIRKHVNFYVGVDHLPVWLLKANQVTLATATGYQIKQTETHHKIRGPASEYPLFILKDITDPHPLTEETIRAHYRPYQEQGNRRNAPVLFFPGDTLPSWPSYISYGDTREHTYYHYAGEMKDNDVVYSMYREIPNDALHAAIYFLANADIIITGITWKRDGSPIVFRNIKQIALANIITQLAQSEHIAITPALEKAFLMKTFGPASRTSYIFHDGAFEQCPEKQRIKTRGDFERIQKEEDRKVDRFWKHRTSPSTAPVVSRKKAAITFPAAIVQSL